MSVPKKRRGRPPGSGRLAVDDKLSRVADLCVRRRITPTEAMWEVVGDGVGWPRANTDVWSQVRYLQKPWRKQGAQFLAEAERRRDVAMEQAWADRDAARRERYEAAMYGIGQPGGFSLASQFRSLDPSCFGLSSAAGHQLARDLAVESEWVRAFSETIMQPIEPEIVQAMLASGPGLLAQQLQDPLALSEIQRLAAEGAGLMETIRPDNVSWW